jgi:hypothetical protein
MSESECYKRPNIWNKTNQTVYIKKVVFSLSYIPNEERVYPCKNSMQKTYVQCIASQLDLCYNLSTEQKQLMTVFSLTPLTFYSLMQKQYFGNKLIVNHLELQAELGREILF